MKYEAKNHRYVLMIQVSGPDICVSLLHTLDLRPEAEGAELLYTTHKLITAFSSWTKRVWICLLSCNIRQIIEGLLIEICLLCEAAEK